MQPIESASDGESTLTLKPMDGINQSPKQRVPVTSQNDGIVTAKIKKKNFQS